MNTNYPTNTLAGETAAAASTAAEGAAQAWATTKEKANEALHSGQRYISENPGPSALGIFAAGVVLGALVGWSLGHEEREDYADETRKILKRLNRKLNLN